MDVDYFIETLGGCGLFQVLLVCVLTLAELTAPFSMMLMAFGNYNPGWRCMDNSSLPENEGNFEPNETFWHYDDDEESCSAFIACQNVQFNSDSSTVVSEWSLVCGRVWISSVIISVQMAGVLVGSYLTGYLGDRIGRKLTFCSDVLANSVFNLIAYFSTSWQMFAATRFLIGLTFNCMSQVPFILASEFSSNNWRSVISSIPSWGVGGVLFALTAMLKKDWRQIHLLISIMTVACLLPAIWAPESIRWLSLKDKKKEAEAVAKKIAKANGKPPPEKKDIDILWKTIQKIKKESRIYSWRHLLKGKATKLTLIFTPIWFTMSLTYYVISFGVKSLTGNLYTNLMISFLTEIPVFFISAYTPNLLGRKKSLLCHLIISTLGLFMVVAWDRLAPTNVRGLSILILVMTVKVSVTGEWYILQVFMAELYPTVIRSTCLGYGSVIARIGGITAPYLIPNDPETYFISFSIMAILNLGCVLLILFLPETKGIQLTDTWIISENENPPAMISTQDSFLANQDEERPDSI